LKIFFLINIFQTFTDIDTTETNNNFKIHSGYFNNDRTELSNSEMNTNSFLKEFLTTDEKTKLSSSADKRVTDLQTKSNYIIYGIGLGYDLWIIENSFGLFLMYHDTTVNLRACKLHYMSMQGSERNFPTYCQLHPDYTIDLDKKHYSGFGFGTRMQNSMVFLQTDNWRISMESTYFMFRGIWDSNFKPLEYRGLKYFPSLKYSNNLGCTPPMLGTTPDADGQGNVTYSEGDCRNVRGQNMSRSADWSSGLQVTYYFR